MFDWGTAIFIELQKFSIYIPFLYFRYISLMSIVGFLHSESGQLELKGGGAVMTLPPVPLERRPCINIKKNHPFNRNSATNALILFLFPFSSMASNWFDASPIVSHYKEFSTNHFMYKGNFPLSGP